MIVDMPWYINNNKRFYIITITIAAKRGSLKTHAILNTRYKTHRKVLIKCSIPTASGRNDREIMVYALPLMKKRLD